MPRASWRGYLRLSLVSCPIYPSLATARTKPIRLHQVWRAAPARAVAIWRTRSEDKMPRTTGAEAYSGLRRGSGGTNTPRSSGHTPASRSQRGRGGREGRGREGRGGQRIRVRPRPVHHTFTPDELKGSIWKASRSLSLAATSTRFTSTAPIPLSRWADGARGYPGDRDSDG
jgi:hypothetical protein